METPATNIYVLRRSWFKRGLTRLAIFLQLLLIRAIARLKIANRPQEYRFNFFIIHYSPNRERLSYLRAALKTDPCWELIERYDRENIEKQHQRHLSSKEYQVELKRRLVTLEPRIRNDASIFGRKEVEVDRQIQDLSDYTISSGNYSLCLKHRFSWEVISKRPFDWSVVIEDDCLFKLNSMRELKSLLVDGLDGVDYVDIGGGCDLHAANAPGGMRIAPVYPPSARTTCAYIISKAFAAKLVDFFERGTFGVLPIDWELNYAFCELRPSVMWAEPEIFVHGSEVNFYKSNLKI